MPTPSILKYSRENVTPSKHIVYGKKSISEARTPNKIGHLISKLRMEGKNLNVSTFASMSSNKVLRNNADHATFPSFTEFLSSKSKISVTKTSIEEPTTNFQQETLPYKGSLLGD
jgi:hypothetical protein